MSENPRFGQFWAHFVQFWARTKSEKSNGPPAETSTKFETFIDIYRRVTYLRVMSKSLKSSEIFKTQHFLTFLNASQTHEKCLSRCWGGDLMRTFVTDRMTELVF